MAINKFAILGYKLLEIYYYFTKISKIMNKLLAVFELLEIFHNVITGSILRHDCNGGIIYLDSLDYIHLFWLSIVNMNCWLSGRKASITAKP